MYNHDGFHSNRLFTSQGPTMDMNNLSIQNIQNEKCLMINLITVFSCQRKCTLLHEMQIYKVHY